MESQEKTTFYSSLKNIQVPDLQTHGKPSESAKEKGKNKVTKWLIPAAIAFIVLQIAALVLWYGHNERIRAKNELNATVSKLQIVEKNGYNVKGFYTDINEQDNRLRSLTSVLLPFIIHDVKAEVAEVDAKVSSQYSTILEKEKQTLVTKLESLNSYITGTRTYDYPSKQSTYDYYLKVKEKIESDAVTIPQVASYSEEITKKEAQMRQELAEVLNIHFAELEKNYSIAVNYDYPSRQAIQTYIETIGGATKAKTVTLPEIVTNLNTVEKNIKVIASEVEDERKELIFLNIATTTQEVDSLLGFFSQRSGYINEINQLNQYKNLVSQYTHEKYKNFTSAALQHQAEKELYPLIGQPRQSKLLAEEKERQELLAKQKQLLAESGIPVPPLDAPKLILIDVGKQRMYAYENGISIFNQAVPITTGAVGFDTVKGKFAIYSKYSPFRMRSPFPGIEYDNMVDFVMFFYQGYGIHDASWRSVYGTLDYPSIGSHGCVNTPYAYIQQLYGWAEIGTTVLVI